MFFSKSLRTLLRKHILCLICLFPFCFVSALNILNINFLVFAYPSVIVFSCNRFWLVISTRWHSDCLQKLAWREQIVLNVEKIRKYDSTWIHCFDMKAQKAKINFILMSSWLIRNMRLFQLLACLKTHKILVKIYQNQISPVHGVPWITLVVIIEVLLPWANVCYKVITQGI